MKAKKMCALLLLAMLGIGSAEANVSFDSRADIRFNVENIADGISVGGSFSPAGSGFDWVYAYDGDSNPLDSSQFGITANNAAGSLGLGETHTFAISGYALSGVVNTNHVGWYQFNFTNNSAQEQVIQLSLDYQFLPLTAGQFVDTSFKLDFWKDANASVSLAYAELSNGFLFAESYDDALTIAENSSAMLYSFTLAAGATQTLNADLTITGSMAAVPLPSAVWIFLTGFLGLLGFKKRKN